MPFRPHILLLALSLMLPSLSPAQEQGKYVLSHRDYELGALGLLMAGAGHYQIWRTQPISPALRSLDEVPRLDRIATRQWSESAHWASHAGLAFSAGTCALLLADKDVRREWVPLLVAGAEAVLLTEGCVALTKSLVLRPRPFMYNADAPLEPKLRPSARFSFISGHTAHTATFSFFAAQVLHDLYPSARWRVWTWTAAAAIPAAVGMLRVAGGKHFPTDIAAGYAIGALSGILLPRLHHRKPKTDPAKPEARLLPAHGGLSFQLTF